MGLLHCKFRLYPGIALFKGNFPDKTVEPEFVYKHYSWMGKTYHDGLFVEGQTSHHWILERGKEDRKLIYIHALDFKGASY